jgi:hypothetical protein
MKNIKHLIDTYYEDNIKVTVFEYIEPRTSLRTFHKKY